VGCDHSIGSGRTTMWSGVVVWARTRASNAIAPAATAGSTYDEGECCACVNRRTHKNTLRRPFRDCCTLRPRTFPTLEGQLGPEREAKVGETTGSDGWNGSAYVAAHYALVLRLVRGIAQQRRLSRDEADELRSLVHLKLVENDFAVLRKFEGRSSLSTYLTKVFVRVWLDQQIAAWGKWRPSAQARRHGPTALRLERLLHRDGLPFEEACTVLLSAGRTAETRATLERLRDSLPRRMRVRVYGQEVLEALPASAIMAVCPPRDSDGEEAQQVLRTRLAQAVVSLPSRDRQLLRLRYEDGWTIARVASELRLDQKRAYREFARVHRTLRTMLSSPNSSTTTCPVSVARMLQSKTSAA